MNSTEIFALALGLNDPWEITDNEAMDTVRRQERLEYDALKGHKYTFLKNPEKLSSKTQNELAEMITLYPTLGEAYRLKVLFNDLWEMPTKQAVLIYRASSTL